MAEEKKNGEGKEVKEGKYLEKENILFLRRTKQRRKRRKNFVEGKYFFAEEKKNREGKGRKYFLQKRMKTSQELRMLSRSLSDCKPMSVIVNCVTIN